jgi:hypothetical protein
VPSEDTVLTTVDLRRAVIARQRLAQRCTDDVPTLLEAVGGLQAQYAPSMYIGCWSRRAGFHRDELTADLEARRVVQGTLLRATIHLVSTADYWPLSRAVGDARRRWWERSRPTITRREMEATADRVRHALAEAGELSRRELEAVAGPGRADGVGLYVDLVRVPPSGTWARRRADRYATAETWIGPPPRLGGDDALDHLVRRYLAGFGPATANEIASWAGLKVGEITPAVARLGLRRFRTEDGKVLVDLPGLPLPTEDGPDRVRFIGTWEALLLVHARRAGILREEDRPRIFGVRTPHSFNTFLVDGVVEGTWRFVDGHIETAPWRPLPRRTERILAEEAEALAAFHDGS